MAYSTLKAADFDAYDGDKLLPGTHSVGLNLRWDVASQLEKINTIHLTENDRAEIDRVLEKENRRFEKIGCRVELAKIHHKGETE